MRQICQPETGYVYTYGASHPPVATVPCGESVHIETVDAFEGRLQSNEDLYSKCCPGPPFTNPQTGPIYVEGAEPGDTLIVHLEEIAPAKDHAVTALLPNFGGLTGTNLTAMLNLPLPESTRILPIRDGQVIFNDKISLPLAPFVGTLGTAPQMEEISSLVPGPWGGNMDCVETAAGHSVWLPVHHPGALFFIGDAHARQGDGELTGVAAEMAAQVTLRFEVLKQRVIEWPRIVSPDRLMTVGSARPLEDAARIAWKQLILWMREDYGFKTFDAYELLGLAGTMRLGNMVDPNYSMVAQIERRWLTESSQ